MELRMYGLVNYQLTGIQMGIQFLHSTIEYSQSVKRKGGDVLNHYNDWADNYKTVILLNGGTTNNNPDRLGSLNKHLQTLKDNQIFCSEFYEIDLGDQLTAVDFLVDERVFGKYKETGKYIWLEFEDWSIINREKYLISYYEKFVDEKLYEGWVKYMGGPKNVFLRNFLKQFRLA